MSIYPDIDATCSSLGYHDGAKYHADEDFLQCLKHLIWVLRKDGETHNYRRYIGRKQIIETDLLPMLLEYADNVEVTDVLLRLLINLTNPALLVYQERLPKDNVGRRNFLELQEILQKYKESFCKASVWSLLRRRLEKILEVDWAERREEQEIIIERILVLMRNVLQVPSNPESERRTNNDVNVHDQVIWALHQSGLLDIVLFIMSSEHEQEFHLHTLEIIFLVFREQEAKALAEAVVGRSEAEKYRDEMELVSARNREKKEMKDFKKLPGRHSRFGGTFVMQNMMSISQNPLICHQSLEHVMEMNFDKDKKKQKKNFRIAPEESEFKRKSALSVRLTLREFCIEILTSAYNSLVRHVRKVLERNADLSHDDSYLLWIMRFFMEFNRCNGFQIELVSESLSTECFFWVVSRMQHHMEMTISDKQNQRVWGKRLHIALQTYKELIFNLQVLQKVPDKKSQALFSILQNNVFYLLEYREIVFHLLINYDERHCTKAYLRDVMETAAFYFKMMEKFCNGRVVVQDKARKKSRKGNAKRNEEPKKPAAVATEEELQKIWDALSPSVAVVLGNEVSVPEEDHPIPFDAASDKNIDDQKGDCMVRIHSYLRRENIEMGVLLLRAAREVWPENDHFGSPTMAPEDELLLLREIFLANIPKNENDDDHNQENENGIDERGEEWDEDEEEEEEPRVMEKEINFEDFIKRLVNPKVVRACTLVLIDWERISTRSLKAVVSILHKIAVVIKDPAMLYQARLFMIFQRVLKAKTDSHNEELKRLATFIVRDFVATVPKAGPKIFAELLFYKSVYETQLIKSGYNDEESTNKPTKWTEPEEEELRFLFMRNQENPETDEDVIDWLARNLVNQNRTRRQIIMKLKSLGLIFKAPTKRSNALAAGKRVWTSEQDERLRELYDKFRMEDDCLERIMETMSLFKSQNAVVNRMLTLGLIADKSEIKPTKRKRASKKPQSGSAMEEGFGSDEEDQREKLIGRFNAKEARSLVRELEGSHQEAIDWLIESLQDAIEDVGDIDEDGIPLVPLSESQMEAVRSEPFHRLMLNLGLHSPDSMETYWRIPQGETAEGLGSKIKILKNEGFEEKAGNETSDEDDAENMFGIWRQRANNSLVYHESDNEEAPRKAPKARKQTTVLSDDHQEDLSISSQQIRSRLNELMDTDDEDDNADVPPVAPKTAKSRIINHDSSDDEEAPTESNSINRQNVLSAGGAKRNRSHLSSDDDDVDDGEDGEKEKQSKAARRSKNKRIVLSDDDDD